MKIKGEKHGRKPFVTQKSQHLEVTQEKTQPTTLSDVGGKSKRKDTRHAYLVKEAMNTHHAPAAIPQKKKPILFISNLEVVVIAEIAKTVGVIYLGHGEPTGWT